jgi:C1A family cysteine protease
MKNVLKLIDAGLFSALVLSAVSCASVSPANSGEALHPLGAKIEYYGKQPLLNPRLSSGTLPSSIDFSVSMPPIGDQETQGSCVAWAVAYYLLTYTESVINSGWNPTNSMEEFSPSWVYNQLDCGIDNGIYLSDAFSLIMLKGCDTLADFPYNQYDYTNQPGALSYRNAAKYSTPGWGYVNLDAGSIKQFLASGKLVTLLILVFTPDFDALSTNGIYDTTNAFTNYQPYNWYNNGSSAYRGGHAICLVGYDDSKQAFKFINSWGPGWGESGYGWITYAFLNSVIIEALAFDY